MGGGTATAGDRPAIDGERLWWRHMELARFGATAKGGVNRLALTPEDVAAHRWLADLAVARGFALFLDDIGNMVLRRPGTEPDAAPVQSGSHLDSQPTGGRFDGAFGVLAAFEALEAIDDAGLATRRPLECVVWNNEEGARFQPGCMGSAVYCGALPLEKALATADAAGATVADGLAALREALPDARPRALGLPPAAVIEAHIEQGPVLEEAGEVIGIVTGMQGNRRFAVEVIGAEAHAGTTPRRLRRDALVDAVAVVAALRRHFDDPEDVVRFTIGRFEVFPGAPTVVPGRVRFLIDFRHPEQAVLDRLGDGVEAACRAAAERCEVRVEETSRATPVAFAGPVPEAAERAARRRGYPHRRIYSGAGHDTRYYPDLCPAGMIFVPCERGISHNEAENAKPADLAAGAQVVADVLVDLAGTG